MGRTKQEHLPYGMTPEEWAIDIGLIPGQTAANPGLPSPEQRRALKKERQNPGDEAAKAERARQAAERAQRAVAAGMVGSLNLVAA